MESQLKEVMQDLRKTQAILESLVRVAQQDEDSTPAQISHLSQAADNLRSAQVLIHRVIQRIGNQSYGGKGT